MWRELDFVYMPSADVAADVAFFCDILGGRRVFAIEAFATRVAMIELAVAGPPVLLAGHLGGAAPVLVYRVDDLNTAVKDLGARGCEVGPLAGIPHGPLRAFQAPGGHRFALYELTRPETAARLEGRVDF